QGNYYYESLRETFAGNLVTTGWSAQGGILRTNPLGVAPLATQYGAGVDRIAQAIPVASGFALAGQTAFGSGGPNDFYALKTDPNDRTGCFETRVPLTPDPRHPLAQAIDLMFVQIGANEPLQPLITRLDLNDKVLCAQCGCVHPPSNMTLWLPFDEPAGPIAH